MNGVIITDFIGLSLAVTFFLVFVISENRSNRARYVMIAGMFIAIMLVLQNLLVVTKPHSPMTRYLFVLSLPLMYAVYPLLNVYIHSFTIHGKKVPTDPATFVLPAVIFIGLVAAITVMPDEQFHQLIAAVNSYQFEAYSGLSVEVWILFVLYYAQFFYFLYRYYAKHSQLKQEAGENFRARWVRYLIYGALAYEIIFFAGWYLSSEVIFLDIVLGDLVILLIGLVGIKHDELLLEMELKESLSGIEPSLDFRQIQSRYDEDDQKRLIDQVQKLVLDNKLYLNPNLNLKSVARRLHLPEKELSIIINENLGKNFSTFINEYRIEAACQLLNSPDMKITSIPSQVGFYSRSAFNTAFKAITGFTPSEFRAAN